MFRRGLGVTPCCLLLAFGAQAVLANGADGAAVFDQHCLSCHGPDGAGIENLGANLVTSVFVASSSPAALLEFLQVGRLDDDPASLTGRPMPGFAWLSESELRAVAAFVQSRSDKR